MYHSLFSHPQTQGHLDYYQILAVMNKAAINNCMWVFCMDVSFQFLWINIKEHDCWLV